MEFLDKEIVQKMSDEMEHVGEIHEKHKEMMQQHMLQGLKKKCDLI